MRTAKDALSGALALAIFIPAQAAGLTVFDSFKQMLDTNRVTDNGWAAFDFGGSGSGLALAFQTGAKACVTVSQGIPEQGCNAWQIHSFISSSPGGTPVQNCDGGSARTFVQAAAGGVGLYVDGQMNEHQTAKRKKHLKHKPNWRQAGCVLQPMQTYYFNMVVDAQGWTARRLPHF